MLDNAEWESRYTQQQEVVDFEKQVSARYTEELARSRREHALEINRMTGLMQDYLNQQIDNRNKGKIATRSTKVNKLRDRLEGVRLSDWEQTPLAVDVNALSARLVSATSPSSASSCTSSVCTLRSRESRSKTSRSKREYSPIQRKKLLLTGVDDELGRSSSEVSENSLASSNASPVPTTQAYLLSDAL